MKGHIMRKVAAALLLACLLAGPAFAARRSRTLVQLDGLKAFVAGMSDTMSGNAGASPAPAAPAVAAAEPSVTASNGPLATALKQSVNVGVDVSTSDNGDNNGDYSTTTDTVTNIIDGVNDIIDTIGKAAVTGAKIAKVLHYPLLDKDDSSDDENDDCDCDKHNDHCDCCNDCDHHPKYQYVQVIPVPVYDPYDHHNDKKDDEKTVEDISFHKLLKAKLGEATDTVLSKWAGAATAAEMLLGLKDTSKVVIEDAEVEKDDTTKVATTTTNTITKDADGDDDGDTKDEVVEGYPYYPYKGKSKDDGKVVVQVILADNYKPDDGKHKVIAAAGAPAVAGAVQAALAAP